MGNCQAIDAAALVIQHPDGRIERLYWPVTASEVMRTNPGHYVSLIIPLPPPPSSEEEDRNQKTVRFTRVKLLRPSETLALGHAYRLITSQEVMKVLKAKKYAKMKKQQQQDPQLVEAPQQQVVSDPKVTTCPTGVGSSDTQEASQHDLSGRFQSTKHQNSRPANSVALKSKLWRPTLQSISEAGS